MTYDTFLSSDLKLGLSADARYASSYWVSPTYNPLERGLRHSEYECQVARGGR